MKLKHRACYLTNRRSEEKRSDMRGTTEIRVAMSSESIALNEIEITSKDLMKSTMGLLGGGARAWQR